MKKQLLFYVFGLFLIFSCNKTIKCECATTSLTGEQTTSIEEVKGCDICGHSDSEDFSDKTLCHSLNKSDSLMTKVCKKAK